jgi:hypothetical protein
VTDGRLTDPQKKVDMADNVPRRWVGAGTMPGSLGYMQATAPLVVLEVTTARLALWLRPGILRKVAGIQSLRAAPGDGTLIQPIKNNWSWPGIEFKRPESPSFYFWTRKRSEALEALAAAGFEVSKEEQPFASRWRAT